MAGRVPQGQGGFPLASCTIYSGPSHFVLALPVVKHHFFIELVWVLGGVLFYAGEELLPFILAI